ncbi:hypothetical protein F5Y13DRAFT_178533 [Hypoxylon sp. FL1857]|nr:hypothetical protein F5Y13DRAFT_178533 [Hypoxylon sp. FL1857]
MGTRGLYIYIWRGRYYVYYNRWDSYPKVLGRVLVSVIPSDPDEYKEWLSKKRSEYSEISNQFERIFTVSPSTLRENRSLVTSGVEKLATLPSYISPSPDDYLAEWTYTLDLDDETFMVIGYTCGFFRLSGIPPDWETHLEEAQNTPTSEILPTTPLAWEAVSRYSELKPVMVHPKRESRLNKRPAFVACKRLYELFISEHISNLWEASATTETQFLFREVVFAMICLASCSPDWVRLISSTNITYSRNDDSFWINRDEDWNYGIVLENEESQDSGELVSRFLRGFHLEGKEAGSAPKCASYWFSNALVILKRDILSQESYYEAVTYAVSKGRSEGRSHFNAIVVSIKHYILVRVVNECVEHTKRLGLVTRPESGSRVYFTLYDNKSGEGGHITVSKDEELGPSSANGQPSCDAKQTRHVQPDIITPYLLSEGDWADDNDESAFEIIAHFFEATQTEMLKPSTRLGDGIFPNEIYKDIIKYLDKHTNRSCLNVSRAFRHFASDTFFMDNELTLVSRPGGEPECFHPAVGFLGPFKPVSYSSIWYNIPETSPQGLALQWIPIVGAPDGSASMEPAIILWFPSRLKGSSTAQKMITDQLVQGCPFVEPTALGEALYESSSSNSHGIDYSLFERFLPTQDTIATSKDVAALYSTAFYLKLGIVEPGLDLGLDMTPPVPHIARLPRNTFMQVLDRSWERWTSEAITFAITWSKQPCEDTVEGWRRATEEAQVQAAFEYRRQAYILWAQELEDEAHWDMAIIICIGAKFKIFHISAAPNLPPRKMFPGVDEIGGKNRKWYKGLVSDDDLKIWDMAGLSRSRFEQDLSWTEISEMLPETGKYATGDVPPLDVRNLEHRPKIERSFGWVKDLADSFGPGTNHVFGG